MNITLTSAVAGDQLPFPAVELAQVTGVSEYGELIDSSWLTREDWEWMEAQGYGPGNPDELMYVSLTEDTPELDGFSQRVLTFARAARGLVNRIRELSR